jgi:hypothetical protein
MLLNLTIFINFFQAIITSDIRRSAADFLLDPWILIQLPFQPVLLHQWAVALLAEAIIFQRKITPIFSYGCPEKLAKISDSLRKILLTMKSCANFTLNMYLKMCLQGQEMNINATLDTEMEEFSNHLTKVLPIIEYVTSQEGNDDNWAIEEIFLEELNKDCKTHPPQVVIPNAEEEPTPLYDFWFWAKKCDVTEVFTGALRRPKNCRLVFNYEATNYYDYPKIAYPKIQERLADLLIRKDEGRLRGVDREFIMDVIRTHSIKLDHFCQHFQQYCGMQIIS